MLKHGDVVKYSNKTLVIISTSKTYQRKRNTKYVKCAGIDISYPDEMFGGSHYSVPAETEVLYQMNDADIDVLIAKGVRNGPYATSLAKSQTDLITPSLVM